MATTWHLDPAHSEVQFKVKHLMITNVTGQFNVMSGNIDTDNDQFEHASVNFIADVTSVNTGNEQRDGHLKSPEFFNSESFPQIKFESKAFNAKEGKITGNLTIKDVTKPVSFDVEFSGINKDPWGNQKAGFSISGKINRTEFNLGWNAPLETGGVLVSEDVKLMAEIQFARQN
jgi:polyisoprenoid-binding protein YceI